jgi:hypothetical protein
VETHVRMMMATSGVDMTQSSVTLTYPNEAEDTTSTTTFTATRVHKPMSNSSNKEFYCDVVRPVVISALAGQSYTILFAGPANSGRSHTIFGSAQEHGMLHYIANDLLKAEDAVTSCSAFKVRRGTLVDNATEKEDVIFKELPPPIGRVALPKSTLLTKVADAIMVPQRRSPEHSFFIQFHVYRKLDHNTQRTAFATITLVDLAVFTPVLSHDLDCLSSSVDRVVSGTDPNFGKSRLTQMLENSLIGSASLLCVGTVTGRPETAAAAAATLRFIERVGKVSQVVSLINIQPPAGFAESLRAWQGVKSRMKMGIENARQAGCAAVYQKIVAQLMVTMSQAPAVLATTDAAVNDARRRIHQETLDAEDSDKMQFEEVAVETGDLLRKAQEHHEKAQRFQKIVREDQAKVDKLEHQSNQFEEDLVQQSIYTKMRLEQLDAELQHGGRERDRFRERRQQLTSERQSLDEVSTIHTEQLLYEASRINFDSEMAALGKKRKRLETALEEASLSAATCNNTNRVQRERKSRASILTNFEMQVSQMQAKVIAKSPAVGKATPSLARSHPMVPSIHMPSSVARAQTPPRQMAPSTSTIRPKDSPPPGQHLAKGIVVSPSPSKKGLSQANANRVGGNRCAGGVSPFGKSARPHSPIPSACRSNAVSPYKQNPRSVSNVAKAQQMVTSMSRPRSEAATSLF